MTPDKHFNRWMRRALVLFIVILAYILVTDITIPMTSYSTVQRPVISIAPQVSGKVTDVLVHNNQTVKKGDVLFRIETDDYQIALTHAELELKKAHQTNDTLRANVAEAEASITALQTELKEEKREHSRLVSLAQKNMVSQQQVDKAATAVESSLAKLKAAEAKKQAILIELGESDQQSLSVVDAQNNVKDAKLNLQRTEIRAPQDGVISNLQLLPGMIAQANQALLSLVVSGKDRISADFREKSISGIVPGTPALVVFDALPGKVFQAELTSRDFGIAQGQNLANGQLATPDDSDRWVRDAQRIRVYVKQKGNSLPDTLISGSKATVMLTETDSPILRWAGNIQMHLVSLLHYVY